MTMKTPLNKVRGLGSAKSGTDHWWMQRVTAVANLVLVTIFVFVMISLVGDDHAAVAARLGNPFVVIVLLALVISVTWHMRLGMQVVIEDYVHSEGLKIFALLANTFFCGGVAIAAAFAILKLGFGA